MQKNTEKVFVIINSYRIGDILLTNPMIQNVKRIYDDAKVVMLTSPALVDVAKYQKGVDDVIVWDRHGEHKGFWKTLKFAWEFPYKKVFAAIPIYTMDRPVMLAKLLRPQFLLCIRRTMISKLCQKLKYKMDFYTDNMQKSHISLLTGITKEELKDVPMVYEVPDCAKDLIPQEKFIVLCPTSSRKEKDMPYSNVVEVIKEMRDYKMVLVGHGKDANIISENLQKENLDNLVDLTGKTSIKELADIMSKSSGVISVDTGTLHLACALNKPTVALFYTEGAKNFIPNPELYNCVLAEDKSAENIRKCFEQVLKY